MRNFYTKSSLELSELRRLFTLLGKSKIHFKKNEYDLANIHRAQESIIRKIVEITKSPA